MVGNKIDFPKTYIEYPVGKLLNVYKQGYARLIYSIQALTIEEMKERVITDKWSIYEIIIHVVDSEIMAYTRIGQAITQSEKEFGGYNQDIWARVLNYTNYPQHIFNSRLLVFNHLRESIYYLLSNVKENDWSKTGIHYEFGEITLRNLLELYADHCERHIDQILERRNIINKPISLEKILIKRLY